jgi:hypothetical protein
MAEEVVIEEIRWTPSARTTFQKIVDYLGITWTDREVAAFVKRANDLLLNIKRHPESNHSVWDIFAGIFNAGIFASTKHQFFKWNLRLLLPNHVAKGDLHWKYNLS